MAQKKEGYQTASTLMAFFQGETYIHTHAHIFYCELYEKQFQFWRRIGISAGDKRTLIAWSRIICSAGNAARKRLGKGSRQLFSILGLCSIFGSLYLFFFWSNFHWASCRGGIFHHIFVPSHREVFLAGILSKSQKVGHQNKNTPWDFQQLAQKKMTWLLLFLAGW